MALIACHECGKQISDKATACPNCGAPPARIQQEHPRPDVSPVSKKPTSPWPAIISLSILTVIAVSCVNMRKDSGAPVEASFDWNDALTMCQFALKKASRDPEKAEVPYVANQGSGDNYHFTWGASTKMARMRNGLGMEVATTASCTVSGTQKRITSLVLDGNTLM